MSSNMIGNCGTSSGSSCVVDGEVVCIKSPSRHDFFLLFPSVTRHSTSSRRQFVHGMPLSTTSHRTFRVRQHWQACEARLLTARPPLESPAAAGLRLFTTGAPSPCILSVVWARHLRLVVGWSSLVTIATKSQGGARLVQGLGRWLHDARIYNATARRYMEMRVKLEPEG